MKALVFSDIHGDEIAASLMEEAINKYSPDLIVLLGDILSNSENSEGGVAKLIRKYSSKILACEGNCDYAPVDEEILNIKMPHSLTFMLGDHTTHIAHVYPYITFAKGDIVMFGHTHVKQMYIDNGVLYLNPGSISRPRDDCRSFALFEDNRFTLVNAKNFEIIQSINF